MGKAGQLMNMAFQGLGIKRQEVYITNIVKCGPPANRVPEQDEAEACLNYLRNQVILVKPKGNSSFRKYSSKECVRKRVFYYSK